MSTNGSNNIAPSHIAIVMDGNGRWAKKRLLPRAMGHRAGVKTTRKIIEYCVNHDIKALTLFAFSSENWARPEPEVSSLMTLFVTALSAEIDELVNQNVVVNFVGERNRLPEKLQNCINSAEQTTKNNTGLHLNIAVNYGGRWDIVNATQKLIVDIKDNVLSVEDLTDDILGTYMSLADQPAPDLFIRSGGESRISNFLLWQLAYTELYFSDALWPDFGINEFETALTWFSNRQRRFGKTERQVIG